MKARSLYARWAEKVDFNGPDGCWIWLGGQSVKSYGSGNYGHIYTAHADGRSHMEYTHRVAYMMIKGEEIPAGFHLDHLCRRTLCCNPDHLEVVTPKENARRGVKGSQTHCIRGHEFDAENTIITKPGRRKCRACEQMRSARLTKTRQIARAAARAALVKPDGLDFIDTEQAS